MSDDRMRFADEELQRFHAEFRSHVKFIESRIKEDDKRYASLLRVQEQNALAIQQLSEATKGVVELHRDIQGVARVGMSVQKFMVWCLKFGAVGTGVVAVLAWIIHYFDKVSV